MQAGIINKNQFHAGSSTNKYNRNEAALITVMSGQSGQDTNFYSPHLCDSISLSRIPFILLIHRLHRDCSETKGYCSPGVPLCIRYADKARRKMPRPR
jgi:hypothetical protein